MRTKARRGLTLIELLVVMTVIAILGDLVPIFSQARKASCTSNLEQMGMA